MKKIIIKIWLGLMVAGLTGAGLTGAQAPGSTAGSGTQLFCTRDFGNFLANGLDFDGEGFTDYFTDFVDIPGVGFSRYSTNYCWFSDIDSLLNRIDTARKQIRQAFYVCDNNTAQKVKKDYYELSAELYYLRHFVDVAAGTNPKDSKAEKDQKVALNKAIRAKFIKRFTKDVSYFDETQASAIFDKLAAKYEPKLESYKNCEDPNLTMLKTKILGIKNTLNTIEQMGKKFVQRTQSVISATQKRIEANPGLFTALGSDSVGDFFNRATSFRVNNEPAFEPTAWEQIVNSAKENTPLVSGGTSSGANGSAGVTASPTAINFNSVAGDITKIEKREDAKNLDLIYLADYDVKYRQVGGAGLNSLEVNLDELKKIITDTFKPMTDVQVCAANIVGKQCGG